MFIRCNFKELKPSQAELESLRLRRELTESASEFEREEYGDFQPESVTDLTPEKQAKLDLLELAYSDICKKLALVKLQLSVSEIKSSAFSALELFLKEFLKNAIDCGATGFVIKIVKDRDNIKVQIHDNGKPIDDRYLKGKKVVDYFSAHASGYDLAEENRYGIQSEKNKKSTLGGCGEGLANCATFLFKNSGILLIGREPKIELLSPKNVRERRRMHSYNEITEEKSKMHCIFNQEEEKMDVIVSSETVLLNENALFNKLKERIAKNESLSIDPKNDGASHASSVRSIVLPDPVPMEVKSETLSSIVKKRKAESNIEKLDIQVIKAIPTSSSFSAPMELESESPTSALCLVGSEPKKSDPYNIGFFSFPPVLRQQDNKQVQVERPSNKPHKKTKKKLPAPYRKNKLRSSSGDD